MFARISGIKHIAFSIKGIDYWAEINSSSIEMALKEAGERIIGVIEMCIKSRITIFTFNLSEFSDFSAHMDWVSEFIDSLAKSRLVNDNKIKLSVMGKWYDLPSKVIDSVKNGVSATSEYDNFFLNLCLNYDGKEEIINALRVIMRSIQYEKISPDQISKQLVKENIYSSYFIPPDLIVLVHDCLASGFMLWDSADSAIYFSGVEWNDFGKKEFKKALEFYGNK
jgi:undecaprenyl diphosphate synthase